MPYHKNKQQAFQHAQQEFVEAQEAVGGLDNQSSDYGHQLNHAMQEIEEATQVINKALVTASEHQRHQLEQYQQELDQLRQHVQE